MRAYTAVFSLCLVIVLLPLRAAQGFTLSGSDLLGPEIQAALRASLEEAGLEADIVFEGTLRGRQKLEAATVEAGIFALADEGADLGDFQVFPVGFQIAAFAVHVTNPVVELTYSQLAGIYQQAGLIANWAELTPAPEWRDRQISPWVARLENIVNLEVFNARVLKGTPLKPDVRSLNGDVEAMLSILIEDNAAILLLPHIRTGSVARFLAVKESDAGQAYTPSADNVYFGDYPLRLPFQLVVSAGLDRETTHALLKAVYSQRVTDALVAAYYLPVTESERRSILAQFD